MRWGQFRYQASTVNTRARAQESRRRGVHIYVLQKNERLRIVLQMAEGDILLGPGKSGDGKAFVGEDLKNP